MSVIKNVIKKIITILIIIEIYFITFSEKVIAV